MLFLEKDFKYHQVQLILLIQMIQIITMEKREEIILQLLYISEEIKEII